MTDQEQISFIGLTLIKGIGSVLGRCLLHHLGNPEKVFSEKKQTLEKVPGIGSNTAYRIIQSRESALALAEKEYSFVKNNKIRLFTIADDDYPFRFRECQDSPLVFFYKGNANLNNKRIISIVGTRKATEYGKEVTNELVKDLAMMFPDIIIVSGLAYGIDICSHRCALKYGLHTIGVLAHGLDRIYPVSHRSVAKEMIYHGGLLTDFISGTEPDRENFLQRNRLIAGLSDTTLVVESAEKGGALVTADIAFSYGRDVYAFPGKINDIYSKGCNWLIRTNKAGLICSATDLISALGWNLDKAYQNTQKEIIFTEESKNPIINLLDKKKTLHINEIGSILGIPIHELTSQLFDLELSGQIKSLPGSIFQLA